ncbi:MAG: hypothetical protein AB7S40_04940, partial [Bacteroidales bacterium]
LEHQSIQYSTSAQSSTTSPAGSTSHLFSQPLDHQTIQHPTSALFVHNQYKKCKDATPKNLANRKL